MDVDILVVDDRPRRRERLAWRVRRLGFQVGTVDAAERILRHLDETRPACVMASARLRDMCLHRLTDAVKQRAPDTAVVGLFARAHGERPGDLEHPRLDAALPFACPDHDLREVLAEKTRPPAQAEEGP